MSVVKTGVTLGVCEGSGVKVSGVLDTTDVLLGVLVESKTTADAVNDGKGCCGCRVATIVITVTVTVPHKPIKAAMIVGSSPFLVDIGFLF